MTEERMLAWVCIGDRVGCRGGAFWSIRDGQCYCLVCGWPVPNPFPKGTFAHESWELRRSLTFIAAHLGQPAVTVAQWITRIAAFLRREKRR